MKAAVSSASLASRRCIVLLSDVLIQEAPNSASSSRVSPTASTRDVFRLSRRPGFEGKTVFVASVCKTLGMPRPRDARSNKFKL